MNVRGAYWHVIQTFVGSLIIILAAVVIRLTDFLEIDPLLGMAFGVVLLWASFGIIRDSVNVFLEAAPPDLDLLAVKARIDGLPGVVETHHIHAWSIASQRTLFSAHVLVDGTEEPDLLNSITTTLTHDYGVYFSTIQIESDCEGEDDAADIEFLR